jgi:anti-sigma regulatory factor (Ser/Thr protein kinase)
MNETDEMFELSTGAGGGEPGEPNGAMVLYPVAESVARARRWFRNLIEPHKPEASSVDDCVLVISELVTNAVLYGEAEEEWRVRVEWWRDGASLHVAVHNPGAPARVQRRSPGEDSEHGRGLWLVDALTDSWQVGPSDFGGAVVSFVMADAWPT